MNINALRFLISAILAVALCGTIAHFSSGRALAQDAEIPFQSDQNMQPPERQENITSTLTSPLMLPIYFCSILLVAIIFEKAFQLRPSRILDKKVLDQAIRHLGAGNIKDAMTDTQKSPTVFARAWSQGLENFLHGHEDLKEALTQACMTHFKPLQNRLQIISTLGVVSPLFGLLGTVIGMIMSFMQISIAGGADKAQLASGIGFALFTTAGGLLVSIPAIISNRYFGVRLNTYSDDLEDEIHRAVYQYNRHRRKDRKISDEENEEIVMEIAGS